MSLSELHHVLIPFQPGLWTALLDAACHFMSNDNEDEEVGMYHSLCDLFVFLKKFFILSSLNFSVPIKNFVRIFSKFCKDVIVVSKCFSAH